MASGHKDLCPPLALAPVSPGPYFCLFYLASVPPFSSLPFFPPKLVEVGSYLSALSIRVVPAPFCEARARGGAPSWYRLMAVSSRNWLVAVRPRHRLVGRSQLMPAQARRARDVKKVAEC